MFRLNRRYNQKPSDTVTAQRFAKRRKNSNRTKLNKERCRRLKKLGLMADSGKAVLPNMSDSDFVINQDNIDFTAFG